MTQSTGLNRGESPFGNYEEIEQAVMETPRGRWFLGEYARRQRGQELSGILRAMERLERALAVRREAAADPLANRIAKAIDSIDDARATPPPPLPGETLEARQLKYFQKDEEVFAPAPPPRPVAVPEPALADGESRGARLTIRRHPDDAAEAPVEGAPAALAMPGAAPQPDVPPKRRIVIIRHKAGDEIDVPLQREMAESA